MNTFQASVRKLLWSIGLVIFSFVCGHPADAQTTPAPKPPSPTATVEPAELIKLLPAAPENWKVTVSRALNQLTGEAGTRTFAIRDYSYTPPPDPATPDKVPPTQKTHFMLVDTGYDATSLSDFANFKVGGTFPYEKNTQRYLLAGHPAILVTTDAGKLMLTFNVAQRVNVILQLENQTEADLQKWLARLDLSAVATLAANAPRTPLPPHRVQLTMIDELNPKLNNTRMRAYNSTAEQAAMEEAERQRLQQQDRPKAQ